MFVTYDSLLKLEQATMNPEIFIFKKFSLMIALTKIKTDETFLTAK